MQKGGQKKKSNATPEKKRINNYLGQAMIQLHADSDIVDLDLSTNKEFLQYIKNQRVCYNSSTGGAGLDVFLKKLLRTTFKQKYDNHFKAFYFEEQGLGSKGGINGYSRGNDYVAVFKGANDQTAAHEFLHGFSLAHSFANNEARKNVEFTYQYGKTDNLMDYTHRIAGHKNDRRSLWYWQWVKANNSIN